ncbi:MAG: hypothetical protein IH958_02040 [Chloroflexi bacterium]|nr:hypothetical protein [Chloroflexota bacterium]
MSTQRVVCDTTRQKICNRTPLGWPNKRCAAPRFAKAREIRYVCDVTYPDFAAFLGEKLGITNIDHRRAEIDTPEVRARFEAGRAGGEYSFEHRSRVNWYQGPETAG